MEQTYLITGICGHLGNNAARLLLARGARVRGFDLPRPGGGDLFGGRAELRYGDLCKPEELEPLFSDSAPGELTVIHAAGIVSIATKFQQKVWDVNVGGTKNVLALCEQYRVRKLVYVSSVHALPEAPPGQVMTEIDAFDPDRVRGLYARTKAEATQAVLDAAARGLDASVVHPSGILGPDDYGRGHLTQLVTDFMTGRLPAGVNGGYDFADVRDVADGILRCCARGRRGRCYILSNRYLTVRALLDALARETGRRPLRAYLPMWAAEATAPLAEWYCRLRRRTPLYTPYSLYTLQSNSLFSHARATEELGYAPRPIEETLRDTAAWLKAQGRLDR